MKTGDNNAGGDAGKTGEFDAAAFKAEMLAEMNKALSGAVKSLKTDFGKLIADAVKAKPGDDGAGGDGSSNNGGDGNNNAGGDGQQQGGKGANIPPEINARLQSLEKALKSSTKQVETLTAEREQERTSRLETERKTAIRTVADTIQFKDAAAKELFLKGVTQDIVRDAEGNLIAKSDSGDLPFKDYIVQQAEAAPFLLAPKGGSGAGATGGVRTGGSKLNIDEMTPAQIANLKPEERQQLYRDIGAQYAAEVAAA